MSVTLKVSPFNVNIGSRQSDSYHFDQELKEFYSNSRPKKVSIVMGNWNAEAGSGKEGKIVGSSGLEEREERGGKLVNW